MYFLKFLWLFMFMAIIATQTDGKTTDESRSDEDGMITKDKTPTKYKSPTKLAPNMKKSMKKVALVGLGTYTGLKLKKINSRFEKATWKNKGTKSWKYADWSSAANREGFLCRVDTDCNWLDEDLECDTQDTQSHSLREEAAVVLHSQVWFGGDATNIKGQCECGDDFWWDDDDLSCQKFYEEGLAWWAVLLIIVALLLAGCGLWACCFLRGCCRRATEYRKSVTQRKIYS